MGLVRKALFLQTGGLVSPSSKKQRVAKQQLRTQKQILQSLQGPATAPAAPVIPRRKFLCPECKTVLFAPAGPTHCPKCKTQLIVSEDHPVEDSTVAPRPAERARPRAVPGAALAGELERLVRLRDSGALTESEFEAAKRKLLD